MQGRRATDADPAVVGHPPPTAGRIESEALAGAGRSVLAVQVLLLVLVLAQLLVVEPGHLRETTLQVALGAYALFLVAVAVGRVPGLRPRLPLAADTVAMVGFITAVLWHLPEPGPLTGLYLLPIVAGGFVLGRGVLVLATLLATGCWFALALVDGAEALSRGFIARALAELVPLWLVATLTGLLLGHLREARRRIRALSDQDPLTGLLNARAFRAALAREHEGAQRYQRRYALLIVDIDRMSALNEALGAAAGNEAITLVADALRRVVRGTDVLARVGGDSFAVFLAETDRAVASKVAQRIRNLVYMSTLQVGARMQRVQVSVGLAAFPVDGDDATLLLSLAEKAMREDGRLRTPPPGGVRIRKR